MTGQDIIDDFNLQVDDASELSSDEELSLLNKIYKEVANDRPWEWLKTTATGTTSVSVPYVALPADFKEMSLNKDNVSIVFVGTEYREYRLIPFSSRRDHRDQDGFCYIDVPNQRLYFTLQPTAAESIEYDYIKRPADLTTGTSPLFNSTYHPILFYGMAARFPSIEQADKGESYSKENRAEYLRYLTDMQVEDANIKLAY